MNRNNFIFIVLGALLLIGGVGMNLPDSIFAQGPVLREPFFVEDGKVTDQKAIGPNSTSEILI
jgi:hypothetical protein